MYSTSSKYLTAFVVSPNHLAMKDVTDPDWFIGGSRHYFNGSRWQGELNNTCASPWG